MENIFEMPFFVVSAQQEVYSTSLHEILSKSPKTILFFYPKDNTPGCTVENQDFSLLKQEFLQLWIQIVWVSKDSVDSHKIFCQQHQLQNLLISDSDLVLHNFFWAYGEKNNYGKIVQWVIRSTFLLDSEGNILKSWKNVKAKNHANKILKEVQE